MSAWVSERKTKQQRKGFQFTTSHASRESIQQPEQPVQLCFPRYKMFSRRKDWLLAEYQRIHTFFFLLLLGIQKQYQTLGKVISWHNQEQTHALFFFLYHNIELAYKGRQITKLKSHVRCNSSHIYQRGRGESTAEGVKNIKIPTRFSQQVCSSDARMKTENGHLGRRGA